MSAITTRAVAGSGTSGAGGEQATVDAAKKRVMRLAAGTGRGTRAAPERAEEMLEAFEALEGLNATLAPADEPELLDGWWALLYNAPADPASASVANTTEGPVLGRLRPFFQLFARSTGQNQEIDSRGGTVANVADFELLGGAVKGSLNLRGTCARASSTRLDVEFTDAVLTLGGWKGTLSLSAVRPQGWVETTFLDGDLRLGRGDKGSIFVAYRGAERDG